MAENSSIQTQLFEESRPRRGFKYFARRFSRDRRAMVGLVIVIVFCLAALLGDLAAPYDPQAQAFELLESPTLGHPLGTDNVGRDLLSRIISGTRISMVVGLSTVALAAAVGIVLGVAAGYYGGWIDMVVMRAIDVLWAFPNFILAVMLVAIFGLGLSNVIVAIALAYVDDFARIIRSMVLVLKRRRFRHCRQGHGRVQPQNDVQAHLPERDASGHRSGQRVHSGRYSGRGGPDLPGSGRLATDAHVGLYSQRRQAFLHPGVVARNIPGRGYHAGGAGGQLRRRRNPRHQRRTRIWAGRNNLTYESRARRSCRLIEYPVCV